MRIMMTLEEEKKAKIYLKKVDPVLGEVIKHASLKPITFGGSYFVELSESIVSQQLSVKAADTIWKRFIALLPDGEVTPENVLAVPDQSIRDAGISWSKISYIKDLGKKTLESGILFEQFEIMTDEEIIEELVKVKGIGRWTSEMFLMFAMGRPDVFSYGDLGLRRAIQKLYKFKKEPSDKQIGKIVNKWKPYRTLACRYLWQSIDQ